MRFQVARNSCIGYNFNRKPHGYPTSSRVTGSGLLQDRGNRRDSALIALAARRHHGASRSPSPADRPAVRPSLGGPALPVRAKARRSAQVPRLPHRLDQGHPRTRRSQAPREPRPPGYGRADLESETLWPGAPPPAPVAWCLTAPRGRAIKSHAVAVAPPRTPSTDRAAGGQDPHTTAPGGPGAVRRCRIRKSARDLRRAGGSVPSQAFLTSAP